MKDIVLVVDDIDINRIILREILGNDYDVVEAAGGKQCVDILNSGGALPQIILLDIIMPDMDGFQTLKLIKANPLTENIPVLFITAADADTNESKCIKEGAVDFIPKPFNPDVVKVRIDNHIHLARYRDFLEKEVEKKTADLLKTHEQMLETMAAIIEYRSLESGAHIRFSSKLTRILVNAMLNKSRFSEQLKALGVETVIKAVTLHDIGKVGIPDNILLKPGSLTPEEFEIIKTHTTIGGDIIDSISSELTGDRDYLAICKDICLYHHERIDGTGYPFGLKGDEIPLAARILAIVDVYEALVSERCYKSAFAHEEAAKIIAEGAGTQFDDEIVKVFLEVQDAFRAAEESR